MFDLFSQRTKLLSRFVSTFVLAAALLTLTGCNGLLGVKRKVAVPSLLTPLAQATTAQLIADINRAAAVRSINGKIDIQFEDSSFAEAGLAEKYRTAEGKVILQRPGQVYLTIQGPFGIEIAQMTSDGERFRVAVVRGDERYRRFVRGTNSAVYPKLEFGSEKSAARGGSKKSKEMSEERAVSALSNLRPQHLTDALLIRPVEEARTQSGFVYAQSEFFVEESDRRPRAKRDARVVRGYYLLDELLAPDGAGHARLMRRFWFDRVDGVRLARLQTFDDDGTLLTDVTYGDAKNFGEGGRLQLPERVELTRPQDRYKLSVSYQSPEAVVIDNEYKPEVFVLENKWQLPELDLDAREKQRAMGKQ